MLGSSSTGNSPTALQSRSRQTWPDRPTADFLVGLFLQEINEIYQLIHPPSFQSTYNLWWAAQERNDSSGEAISDDDLSFGILVLRICLLGIQNLPHSQYPTTGALSTHLDHLEYWFNNLADELEKLLPLEKKPSLVTVQHRFLHVCYLKNYAKIRQSWAILSTAVKDAHELGLHLKDPGLPLSDLEMELRRRTFWNLYVCDRFMYTFFGHWPLIPEGYFDLDPPHDNLDTLTTTSSYTLTRFTDRVFHIKLARFSTAFLSPPSWKSDQFNASTVADFAQRFQEVIVDQLPPPYWLETPDTSMDVVEPTLARKREWLYLLLWSTKATLYRGFADPCNQLHRETKTPQQHGTDLLTLSHRRSLMATTCKVIAAITRLYDLIGDEEGGAVERLFLLPVWLVDALAGLGVCLLSIQADERRLAVEGMHLSPDAELRHSFTTFFEAYSLLGRQAPQYGLAKRGLRVLEGLHGTLHALLSSPDLLASGAQQPFGAGSTSAPSFGLEHTLMSLHGRSGEDFHGRTVFPPRSGSQAFSNHPVDPGYSRMGRFLEICWHRRLVKLKLMRLVRTVHVRRGR
ncbi:hypothetical protein N7462_004319 [Penicillium macrosclerotiorum]|uniref:uncharacterized protein n=1 Tax=Penicillium macrosclerotiorum TaxID=303699 RepID=UPI002547A709|nr:uncharacterized protein N7462_004319 [Penicillium macrosclerotiorum]KAJ5689927.1 hypothetical protein N7462_004319 [Penicillium macrosclerotiorum]